MTKRVPEIRFEGFRDDWEQRKLGEESTIVAGGDVDKTKLFNVGEYQVLANALTNEGVIGYYEDDYRIEAPAVTVTGRGDVGYAKARKSNFTPVVRLLAVKSEHNVDFLEAAINNHKTIVESTGVPQLTVPQLSNYNIYFPLFFEEEKKIGKFFKQLDDTIALHQRKLEQLQSMKDGFLQKMFPKDGEKEPEIRFPGFTDDWEQRKLKTIGSFSKGRGYTKKDLTVQGNPILLYGHLYTNYQTIIQQVDSFVIKKENSILSEGNEVVVPSSGESPEDIARASVVENKGIILGGDLNVIKVNEFINPVYLALIISNGKTQQELSKKAQGKSIVHLHNSDLKQVHFSYTHIEEQTKIANLIMTTESIITLHQRELELLKQTKKAFLQKMFV